MIHSLKILPEYYKEVKSFNKQFELRKNDRDYKVGDVLLLKCWDGEKFTDDEPLRKTIKYILKDCPNYGLKKGYVILGL